MKQVHATIRGKVQGVFFRAWTRDTARALGLAGWVRNLPGGGVETMAQGEERTLRRFVEALEQGPPLSRVIHVDHAFRDASSPLSGFEIRR